MLLVCVSRFIIHYLQATYPCVLASQEIFVRFYLFGVASVSLQMLIIFSFAFSSSQERRGGEESQRRREFPQKLFNLFSSFMKWTLNVGSLCIKVKLRVQN